MSLVTSRFEYDDVVIAERRVQALDFDPARKVVYWSDSSLRTIKRSSLPDGPGQVGYPQDLTLGDIKEPSGIAIDWVAR